MNGPHVRDYQQLLDEHADQTLHIPDEIAEHVRKIGGTTIRSIGYIARFQRILNATWCYIEEIHGMYVGNSASTRS